MEESRDLKKEKFSEPKKRSLKVKPIYVLGLIVIVAAIVVGITFLPSDSDDPEIVLETSTINNTSTIGNTGGIDDPVNGVAMKADDTPSPMSTLSVAAFNIKGMTCGGCSGAIMRGLGDADGVTRSNISWRDKEGIVEYDPTLTNPREIAEFITSMGFAATVIE